MANIDFPEEAAFTVAVMSHLHDTTTVRMPNTRCRILDRGMVTVSCRARSHTCTRMKISSTSHSETYPTLAAIRNRDKKYNDALVDDAPTSNTENKFVLHCSAV